MTSKTSNTVESPKLGELLPIIGFFQRNIFQTFGMVISLVGILGFTAGKSFEQGWYQAAATPHSFFPTDSYEFVLQGLMLSGPWKYGSIFFGAIAVMFVIMHALDLWQSERNKLVRNRRKSFESSKARRIRRQIVTAARQEKIKGPDYHNWKSLESRGLWAIRREASITNAKNYPLVRLFGMFILHSSMIILLAIIFWILKTVAVDEARASGVREYIGLYTAVTGRLPIQFKDAKIPEERLKEYVCNGQSEIWKYRSISIQSSKESTATQAYLLRGSDKALLILDSSGSDIRLLNDERLSLKESENRSMSPLVASLCPAAT